MPQCQVEAFNDNFKLQRASAAVQQQVATHRQVTVLVGSGYRASFHHLPGYHGSAGCGTTTASAPVVEANNVGSLTITPRHATARRDAAHASRLQANVRARHRPCSAVAHLARRACRPCTPAHAGSPLTRRDFAGAGFALAAAADDLRRFFFVAAAARPEPAPPAHCGQLLASPVAE